MRLQKALQLAFNTLVHSKLRSWLTIIGIVIGIGAVVAILSVSEGAKQALQEQLGGLGADMITISPGFSRASGAAGGFRGGGPQDIGGGSATATSHAKNLTERDVTVIKNIPNVAYVMGLVSGRADIVYGSKSTTASIHGVDSAIWKYMVTTDLSAGRYLTQGDTNAIVVGSRVAHSVFEEDLQINRQVTIEGKVFRIVGILEEAGGSDDSAIIMPISMARDVLEDVGENEFNSISVKIKDVDQTNETLTQIDQKLMLSRGILQEKNKDFTATSPLAFQERITSALNSISLFLAAIAAISLIVGAVGISNTMFTSVLEKTKEIGIMKAIGAQNKDILLIFLFKSGMLGFVGGLGGVILGLVASLFVGQFTGASVGRLSLSSTYISPYIVFGAFAVSILVGMIAGVIPAYRASRLKPVDALRYE